MEETDGSRAQQRDTEYRTAQGSIPDFAWIRHNLPIADVARRLELRFAQGNMLHCWHPERHLNGDRTASAAIWTKQNKIKCFGCGLLVSVVDLVMDVLEVDAGGAARWIEANFDVPRIPKGKHLQSTAPIRPYLVGHEQPIELLIKSGLWANLSMQTQRIAPVLIELAERKEQNTFRVRISYRAIMHHSGVRSEKSVRKALTELEEIGWLSAAPRAEKAGRGILRDVGAYLLTPYSDLVQELANAVAAEMRTEIEQERELRRQRRAARKAALAAASKLVAITRSRSAR
jgi:hypothetical protein